jgi:1-deoxy-D-xylulose-5-phosphate reductoisomerase
VGQLSFEAPDEQTFPCLRLAREAAAAGGTAPCVLNAANEVAVQAFLEEEIGFTAIADVIERALAAHEPGPVRHFSDLYRADAEARLGARELIRGVAA